MSSSNYRRNKAMIDQFRKELTAMFGDIQEIDTRVLNRAVNKGLKRVKNNSPVITGFFRKSWSSAPAVKSKSGKVTKTLANKAEYASYVNYGHRTVDKDGNTTGYVRSKLGDHLLEKAVNEISMDLISEFRKEVEAVQKKHD